MAAPAMLGAMKTVTCPACGLSFETTATTNTRCRRCRKVVIIGTRSTRAVTRSPAASRPMTEDEEPFDEGTEERKGGWVAAAIVGAAAVVLAIIFGRKPPE